MTMLYVIFVVIRVLLILWVIISANRVLQKISHKKIIQRIGK